MVLLELLTTRADELVVVVVLGVDDDLVGVVAVVSAVQYLILILNLIIVWQLC